MRILVIGGGGREHAFCWALSRTATVFCAPGNPGTAACATNLPVDVSDHQAVLHAIKANSIDLAVVGPEGPLAAGLVDHLTANGVRSFGPTASAARIESSKAFAKGIMAAAEVPTAHSETFTQREPALAYIDQHVEPLVIKASGLAAGKGAVVCETREQAHVATTEMFAGRYGTGGTTVLVEDFLEGEEISVFVLTDGEHTLTFPACQDHKRLMEGDRGPNTGGMGAYCPVSIENDALIDRVHRDIIEPTLRQMTHSGAPFCGVLYAGLMISSDGSPSVVEFNCRFGDPEAQVVFPLFNLDWAEIFWDIADGSWKPPMTTIKADRSAVTTVLASEGYPTNPRKGATIDIPSTLPEHSVLFHAGTRRVGDTLEVSGGRVLAATGIGTNIGEAIQASRRLVDAISFEGKIFRADIGWREEERHANA